MYRATQRTHTVGLIEGVFYQQYREKLSIDIVLKLTKTLARVQRCCVQKIVQKYMAVWRLTCRIQAYVQTDIQTDIHTCLPACSPFRFFPHFLLGPFTRGKPQCGGYSFWCLNRYTYICICLVDVKKSLTFYPIWPPTWPKMPS